MEVCPRGMKPRAHSTALLLPEARGAVGVLPPRIEGTSTALQGRDVPGPTDTETLNV